jgi:hypothetical protein
MPYLGDVGTRSATAMLSRLAASLQKTVVVTVSPESFTFASPGREATIDTVLRVAPDNRILGFGRGRESDGARRLRLFDPDGNLTDERALVALCRHGLMAALGPWSILAVRPRVVVHAGESVRLPPETFTRVLRAAGAMTVELAPR